MSAFSRWSPRLVALAWAFGMILALVPSRTSAKCIDYSDTFRYLGSTDLPAGGQNVAAQGSFVYTTWFSDNQCWFRVFDVSTVGQPGGSAIPRGTIAFPGGAQMWLTGIALYGDRAYVTCGPDHGLVVVNVTDPDAPGVVSIIPIPDEPTTLAVAGDHLLVETERAGLEVFSLADPDHPNLDGHWGSGPGESGIAVEGHYAYLCAPGDLFVILDVSDPSHPAQVAAVAGIGQAICLTVRDGLVFIGRGNPWDWNSDGLLTIVDARDPAHPSIESSTELSVPVSCIALRDQAAYLAGGHEYMPYGSLTSIDISYPAHPVVARIDWFDGRGRGICIQRDAFYFTCGTTPGELGYGHAASSVAPLQIGRYSAGGGFHAIAAAQDMACVIDDDDPCFLRMVDVSQPAQPAPRGSLPLPGLPRAVAVKDNYVYEGGAEDEFSVIGIQDPDNPTQIATITNLYPVVKIRPLGSMLYLACNGAGLAIVNISNPASPVLLSTLPTYNAYDVAVVGHHAYVADVTSLQVIDVQNPMLPRLVGSLDVGARGVAGSSGVLYLIGAGGIDAIDISDPVHPVIAGSASQADPLDLWIDGGYLYVASYAGVDIFDISEPLRPYLVGEAYNPPGVTNGVTVTSRLVLTAAASGLVIFPQQCEVTGALATPPASDGLRVLVAPNPAAGTTRIAFTTSAPERACARIFDAQGRVVSRLTEGWMPPGSHVVAWNGRDDGGRALAAGTYWIRIEAGKQTGVQRIVRLSGGGH